MRKLDLVHTLKLENNRPTIAVLIGSMASTYHEGIMRGVASIAEESDYNVIGFCGGPLNSSDPLVSAHNEIFNLVNKKLISGVISPFSSHTRFLSEEDKVKFINEFSGIPVVNIGSNINHHTNIITNYESGLSELFDHLYHTHGYRNILLLRGPKYHASSEQRMAIYQNLLKKYKIPFNEELVIYSDLRRDDAKQKLTQYLKYKKRSIDAIITVSDNQAFGVMDACQEVGLKIPEDIAVVGSMNTLESEFTKPSLTSINEPLFDLGRIAALELIDKIEGKESLNNIELPTSINIRCSCGGLISKKESKPQSILEDNKYSVLEEINYHVNMVRNKYERLSYENEIIVVIESFEFSIKNDNYSKLFAIIKNHLECSPKSLDLLFWLEIISHIQIVLLINLTASLSSINLTKFITNLTMLKSNVAQNAIKFQKYSTNHHLSSFSSVISKLNTSFDLATFKDYAIDTLDLSDFYISIFDSATSMSGSVVTNIVAVKNKQRSTQKNKSFIASELVPDNTKKYDERYTLLVLPISFSSEFLGFMVTNLNHQSGIVLEDLRAIISSSLKNEMLFMSLKKAEERFSDIADSTSKWLWETNVDHCFTYSSNSSLKVIGYKPIDLIGKSIGELFITECNKFIQSIADHEELEGYEFWFKNSNSKVLCLSVSAKPIIKEGIFRGYRGVFDDVTEKRIQQEKIKNLAYSDALTELPNRLLFQNKLNLLIDSSSKNNKKFALIFIDIDHFKFINDSMGHSIGDKLLIKLSKRLKLSIRKYDLLARLGGDEFVIMLPNIDSEKDVTQVVQHIFDNIKNKIVVSNYNIPVTLSLGISLFPTDATNAESLLKCSDAAMYKVKSQGRNSYSFYDKKLEENKIIRDNNEKILREAISENNFIVYYQPQVSTKTKEITGFEALVRIETEELGIVSPANFISLAEELQLIDRIDELVFESACMQYSEWQSQNLNKFQLSINLSSLSLSNIKILDKYINIMKSYNVDPKYIQIEITENSLIENKDTAISILKGFKDYGVKIALDDFGTGYSSLSYINNYPIDTVKIDRSFISNMIDNKSSQAIIKGIVLISEQLNFKIIAEGVETQLQYNMVEEMRCDTIQGYFCYKPVPAKEAKSLLLLGH